jgi:putative thioredoxin
MQILSDMNQLAHKVKDKCAFGILNVDNNIKIAQMIGINEVPILLAIKQGQGISSFPGYIDRNAVVQFVDQLKLGFTLGSESDAFEAVLNQGKLLEDEEDITGAAKVYSQILSAQAKFEDLPKFKARAYGGLARLALKEENVESAEEIVNLLKSDYPDYISVPDVASAFFGLAIYEEKKNSPFKTIEQARAELEQNPKSLEAEYFLGVLLLSSGAYEDGIEQILKVVKKDRRWNDEAPKKLLMQVFSALGNSHPVTIKGRRRLANYLF